MALPVRFLLPSLGPPLDRYAAVLAVFALSAAGVIAAARWTEEHVRRSPLAPVDRLGGALMGGAKGLLAVYVGLFVILCFPSRPLARDLRASVSAPALLRMIGATAPLFPPEMEARGREVEREIVIAREQPAPGAAPIPCAVDDAGPTGPRSRAR